MKALILAAGRGSRLNKKTMEKNKCMLEFKGKHIIEYSLNNVIDAGIDEVIIVVGYKSEDIINFLGIEYKGLKIKYVFQTEQKGLVDAILQAKLEIGNSDFMLLLGDELMKNAKHQEMLKYFNNNNEIFALCGMVQQDNPDEIKKTYSILGENKTILRLIEKPRNVFSKLMGTGDCIFKNKILDYIDITPIHHNRKEKELPDMIQCAIDDGFLVEWFYICDAYSNINTEDDISIASSIIN